METLSYEVQNGIDKIEKKWAALEQKSPLTLMEPLPPGQCHVRCN